MQGPPNFLERQVELALQALLDSRFSAGAPIFYEIADEATTGADLTIAGAKPIFLQAKRSSWMVQEENLMQSPQILLDRFALQLSYTHSLFFDLHPKKPSQEFSQNEILFLTNHTFAANSRIDCARYIAPLHVEVADYLSAVGATCRKLRAGVAPSTVADEHICFPPEFFVDGTGHSYSFTTEGTELAFHDPRVVDLVTPGFLEWISQHIDPESWMTIDEIEGKFYRLAHRFDRDRKVGTALRRSKSPIGAMAQYLRRNFDIVTVFIRGPKETDRD